jgi:predicted O-methyltransferase YrrM
MCYTILMNFTDILTKIEEQAHTLVWWSPDQIERGEDKENNPKKGNRPWSVPRETGQFLHDTVLERKPKMVLELGTSIGYSTVWIGSALIEYGGHLHTIENMPEKYAVAIKNISEAGLNEIVTPHFSQINEVLLNLDSILNGEKIDLVFMDADRGHYHEYFPLIKKHLSQGALIIADNAGNMAGRMQSFFDLLTKEGWHYEIKDMDNGLLVASDPAANHNS